jgi:hypothetical protein
VIHNVYEYLCNLFGRWCTLHHFLSFLYSLRWPMNNEISTFWILIYWRANVFLRSYYYYYFGYCLIGDLWNEFSHTITICVVIFCRNLWYSIQSEFSFICITWAYTVYANIWRSGPKSIFSRGIIFATGSQNKPMQTWQILTKPGLGSTDDKHAKNMW